MNRIVYDLADFSLRDVSDNCICYKANHNALKFGEIHGENGYHPERWIFDASSNPYSGEICLCCSKELLMLNTYNCYECGCYLCGNCTLYTLHYDIDCDPICYSCRDFGHYKNDWFLYNINKFRTFEEWCKWYLESKEINGVTYAPYSYRDWSDSSRHF